MINFYDFVLWCAKNQFDVMELFEEAEKNRDIIVALLLFFQALKSFQA